ncbi:MAG: hypothetical protein K9N49_08145, partial [Candidatus Marinimicrobia bacterium]|nr:hypothetical protein [Candidatus Neomarinimicrobiota bacterium]
MKTLRHGPWLLLLVLWASAFSLACRLDDGSRPPRPAGWGAAVLGSLRGGLSRHLYFEADRDFHGGLEHTRDPAFEDGLERVRQALTPP